MPENHYRYTLQTALGTSQPFALGEADFGINWELQDENLLTYTKDFSGKIALRDAGYNELLSIEQSTNRCDIITINIERFCGGVWVAWFSGRFNLNTATWDLYRCVVELKLDKNQAESCLDDNKSTEVNLFDFISATVRQTAILYNSSITVTTRTDLEITDFYDSSVPNVCTPEQYYPFSHPASQDGYTAYYHFYQTEDLPNSRRKCYKETRWARQELTLPTGQPSPGSEWILLSSSGGNDLYVKPAGLFNCSDEAIIPTGNILGGRFYHCDIIGYNNVFSGIDNGMKLADCLQAFLSNSCLDYTVKSDFFQINPVNVSTVNYVTGLASKVRNIIVFQKSDVKRPNVSGNATKAVATFEKFITALVEMFNCRWRVEANVLVIEHISFFTKNAGFNLANNKQAKTLTKYSYKTEDIPQKETYTFMEASQGDFTGLPITYEGGCVAQKQDKAHSVEGVTTDIELCLSNPDAKSNIVSDNGFVFIACDDNNLVLSEPGILQTGSRLNNTLAWAQLHRDYHGYYRALNSGYINGTLTNFLSVRPLKKGVAIKIPLCCGDTFNPDDTVLTPLGVGTVEKATYDFKSEFLTLELLYPADDSLNIIPPVAVNDIFSRPSNSLSSLLVLENDRPNPSYPVYVVEIVTPPMHGTASVLGTSILYQSDAGFTGADNLVYRLKDSRNVYSNNALVVINVT